jgi:hypothetical protein
MVVDQFNRKAVEFRFDRVLDSVRAKLPFHPLVESEDIRRTHQGIQAQHGSLVLYLSEFVQRRGPHALSRGIGSDELRVCLLEVGQFSEQSIILPVGNLGVVLDIIEVVVMSDPAF